MNEIHPEQITGDLEKQKELWEGQAMSCPSGSLGGVLREELRMDVRDVWLHRLLPIFESLVKGRGSSRKGK